MGGFANMNRGREGRRQEMGGGGRGEGKVLAMSYFNV
jgi:hypothetical protein